MKKNIAALFFLSVFLVNIPTIEAATSATTILSGGVSVSGNYNITKTDTETTDTWRSSANANLSLVHSRVGPKGGLSINYGINYQYQIRDGESTLSDQRLSLGAWRHLTKHLSFNLTNTFLATNDLWAEWLSPTATGLPEPAEQLGEGGNTTGADVTGRDEPTLSAKIGREKFWTNDLYTSLNYQYAQSGSLTVGYGNSILEYDEPDSDNYQRDSGTINISQGLAPRWNVGLSYTYTDAQFDISEDFISHSGSVSLGYTRSVQDSFSASANYYEKNYDIVDPESPTNPNNNYIIGGGLGWTHNFSPLKTLSMSGGLSVYHEDNREDDQSPNLNMNYTSKFEHGSWFIEANEGYTDRSFEGISEDQGISKSQRIQAGAKWQVAKDVNAGIGASITNDNYLGNPLASDEKTYSAYGNISYRFWRWFHVSGRYYFIKTDAEVSADDSEEHRFFITLGASRELYRWIHGKI